MLVAAMNNSKQRISRNRERLNFILGFVVVESAVLPKAKIQVNAA